ncbi:hypothetical protein DYB32_001568, partial [Aphanomyces invadans]
MDKKKTGVGSVLTDDWESDLAAIIEKTNQNLNLLRKIGEKRDEPKVLTPSGLLNKLDVVLSAQEKCTRLDRQMSDLEHKLQRLPTLEGLVDTLTKRVQELERQASRATADGHGIAHAVEVAVNKSMASLDGSLSKRMDAVTEMHEAKTTSFMKTLQSQRENYEKAIQFAIDAGLGDVHMEMDQVQKRIDTRLHDIQTSIDARVAVLHKRVGAMEVAVTDTERSADSNDQLRKLSARVDSCVSKQQVSTVVADHLADYVESHRRMEAALVKAQQDHDRKWKGLSEGLASTQEELSHVHENVASVQSAMQKTAKVENQVLRAKLLQCVAELDELRQVKHDLDTDLDRRNRDHDAAIAKLAAQVAASDKKREDDVQTLTTALMEKSVQVASTAGKLTALQECWNRDVDQLHATRAMMHKARRDSAEMRAALQQCQSDLSRQNLEKKHSVDTIRRLTAQWVKAKEDVAQSKASLQQEMKQHSDRVSMLESTIAKLQSTHATTLTDVKRSAVATGHVERLTSDLASAQLDLQAVQQELERVTLSKATLEAQLHTAISQLKADDPHRQSAAQARHAALDNANAKLHDLMKRETDVVAAVQALCNTLATTSATTVAPPTLVGTLHAMHVTIQDWQTRQTGNADSISALQRQVHATQDELSAQQVAWEIKLKAHVAKLDCVLTEKAHVEEDLAAHKAKLNEELARKRQIEDDAAIAAQGIATKERELRGQVEGLEAYVAELVSQKSSLELSLASLEAAHENSARDAQIATNSLATTVASLQDRLSESLASYERASDEIEALEAKLQELHASNQTLTDEYNAACVDLHDAQDAASASKAQTTVLELELANAQEQCRDREGKLLAAQAQVECVTSKIETLESTLLQVQTELTNLHQTSTNTANFDRARLDEEKIKIDQLLLEKKAVEDKLLEWTEREAAMQEEWAQWKEERDARELQVHSHVCALTDDLKAVQDASAIRESEFVALANHVKSLTGCSSSMVDSPGHTSFAMLQTNIDALHATATAKQRVLDQVVEFIQTCVGRKSTDPVKSNIFEELPELQPVLEQVESLHVETTNTTSRVVELVQELGRRNELQAQLELELEAQRATMSALQHAKEVFESDAAVSAQELEATRTQWKESDQIHEAKIKALLADCDAHQSHEAHLKHQVETMVQQWQRDLSAMQVHVIDDIEAKLAQLDADTTTCVEAMMQQEAAQEATAVEMDKQQENLCRLQRDVAMLRNQLSMAPATLHHINHMHGIVATPEKAPAVRGHDRAHILMMQSQLTAEAEVTALQLALNDQDLSYVAKSLQRLPNLAQRLAQVASAVNQIRRPETRGVMSTVVCTVESSTISSEGTGQAENTLKVEGPGAANSLDEAVAERTTASFSGRVVDRAMPESNDAKIFRGVSGAITEHDADSPTANREVSEAQSSDSDEHVAVGSLIVQSEPLQNVPMTTLEATHCSDEKGVETDKDEGGEDVAPTDDFDIADASVETPLHTDLCTQPYAPTEMDEALAHSGEISEPISQEPSASIHALTAPLDSPRDDALHLHHDGTTLEDTCEKQLHPSESDGTGLTARQIGLESTQIDATEVVGDDRDVFDESGIDEGEEAHQLMDNDSSARLNEDYGLAHGNLLNGATDGQPLGGIMGRREEPPNVPAGVLLTSEVAALPTILADSFQDCANLTREYDDGGERDSNSDNSDAEIGEESVDDMPPSPVQSSAQSTLSSSLARLQAMQPSQDQDERLSNKQLDQSSHERTPSTHATVHHHTEDGRDDVESEDDGTEQNLAESEDEFAVEPSSHDFESRSQPQQHSSRRQEHHANSLDPTSHDHELGGGDEAERVQLPLDEATTGRRKADLVDLDDIGRLLKEQALQGASSQFDNSFDESFDDDADRHPPDTYDPDDELSGPTDGTGDCVDGQLDKDVELNDAGRTKPSASFHGDSVNSVDVVAIESTTDVTGQEMKASLNSIGHLLHPTGDDAESDDEFADESMASLKDTMEQSDEPSSPCGKGSSKHLPPLTLQLVPHIDNCDLDDGRLERDNATSSSASKVANGVAGRVNAREDDLDVLKQLMAEQDLHLSSTSLHQESYDEPDDVPIAVDDDELSDLEDEHNDAQRNGCEESWVQPSTSTPPSVDVGPAVLDSATVQHAHEERATEFPPSFASAESDGASATQSTGALKSRFSIHVPEAPVNHDDKGHANHEGHLQDSLREVSSSQNPHPPCHGIMFNDSTASSDLATHEGESQHTVDEVGEMSQDKSDPFTVEAGFTSTNADADEVERHTMDRTHSSAQKTTRNKDDDEFDGSGHHDEDVTQDDEELSDSDGFDGSSHDTPADEAAPHRREDAQHGATNSEPCIRQHGISNCLDSTHAGTTEPLGLDDLNENDDVDTTEQFLPPSSALDEGVISSSLPRDHRFGLTLDEEQPLDEVPDDEDGDDALSQDETNMTEVAQQLATASATHHSDLGDDDDESAAEERSEAAMESSKELSPGKSSPRLSPKLAPLDKVSWRGLPPIESQLPQGNRLLQPHGQPTLPLTHEHLGFETDGVDDLSGPEDNIEISRHDLRQLDVALNDEDDEVPSCREDTLAYPALSSTGQEPADSLELAAQDRREVIPHDRDLENSLDLENSFDASTEESDVDHSVDGASEGSLENSTSSAQHEPPMLRCHDGVPIESSSAGELDISQEDNSKRQNPTKAANPISLAQRLFQAKLRSTASHDEERSGSDAQMAHLNTTLSSAGRLTLPKFDDAEELDESAEMSHDFDTDCPTPSRIVGEEDDNVVCSDDDNRSGDDEGVDAQAFVDGEDATADADYGTAAPRVFGKESPLPSVTTDHANDDDEDGEEEVFAHALEKPFVQSSGCMPSDTTTDTLTTATPGRSGYGEDVDEDAEDYDGPATPSSALENVASRRRGHLAASHGDEDNSDDEVEALLRGHLRSSPAPKPLGASTAPPSLLHTTVKPQTIRNQHGDDGEDLDESHDDDESDAVSALHSHHPPRRENLDASTTFATKRPVSAVARPLSTLTPLQGLPKLPPVASLGRRNFDDDEATDESFHSNVVIQSNFDDDDDEFGANVHSDTADQSVMTANGAIQEKQWQDVQVGDILFLKDKDELPADVLILATSEEEGRCFVETCNLDGETNLKRRTACEPIAKL